jgi:methyl-accepting chemotaxis protein
MIRPQSIKQKLKGWVAIIFVLTGTAGWAGIWGLLYLSKSTKELTGEQVQRADEAGAVRAEVAAARQLDRDFLLGVALNDAPKAKDAAARTTIAWNDIGNHVKQLKASAKGETLDAIEAEHGRVVQAWAGVISAANGGKALPELRTGAYADYEKRVGELEGHARAIADGSFGAVRAQMGKIFDWIWLLQVFLFVTVGICQGFSAWAGWKLSKSLTSELAALKDSAEKISMGDLKNEVKIDTTDIEIIEVGQALDRLRVSLGKAMDRLAAKRAAAHQADS